MPAPGDPGNGVVLEHDDDRPLVGIETVSLFGTWVGETALDIIVLRISLGRCCYIVTFR